MLMIVFSGKALVLACVQPQWPKAEHRHSFRDNELKFCILS